MTKNIRVDEKVHQQVKKIADANFRGMGDQVAYWAAMDCAHPLAMREEKIAHVAGTGEKLHLYYCRQCDRHIFDIDRGAAANDQTSLLNQKKSAQLREIAMEAA